MIPNQKNVIVLKPDVAITADEREIFGKNVRLINQSKGSNFYFTFKLPVLIMIYGGKIDLSQTTFTTASQPAQEKKIEKLDWRISFLPKEKHLGMLSFAEAIADAMANAKLCTVNSASAASLASIQIKKRCDAVLNEEGMETMRVKVKVEDCHGHDMGNTRESPCVSRWNQFVKRRVGLPSNPYARKLSKGKCLLNVRIGDVHCRVTNEMRTGELGYYEIDNDRLYGKSKQIMFEKPWYNEIYNLETGHTVPVENVFVKGHLRAVHCENLAKMSITLIYTDGCFLPKWSADIVAMEGFVPTITENDVYLSDEEGNVEERRPDDEDIENYSDNNSTLKNSIKREAVIADGVDNDIGENGKDSKRSKT